MPPRLSLLGDSTKTALRPPTDPVPRVRALGGSLSAGPRDGGWLLAARLPLT